MKIIYGKHHPWIDYKQLVFKNCLKPFLLKYEKLFMGKLSKFSDFDSRWDNLIFE